MKLEHYHTRKEKCSTSQHVVLKDAGNILRGAVLSDTFLIGESLTKVPFAPLIQIVEVYYCCGSCETIQCMFSPLIKSSGSY